MKLIKKEKIGNKRKITVLGFIKFNYKSGKNIPVVGFSGDYPSWEDVKKECMGYGAQNILDKTLEATLKVKRGEAVFERDSVIFDKIQYSFPLLSCLFKIAVENGNKLNVIDFGGALGSHYFQNKEILKPIEIENWTVVEQPHYVEIGNEKIAEENLNFKKTIDEVEGANVLILSSVLQYLQTPYEWIDKFVKKGVQYIIVDRTAFSTEGRNRLTLETVAPEIYEAKYPAWFLNEQEFLEKFKNNYDLVLDFVSTIDKYDEIPSYYKGFLFKLKK